MQRVIRNLLCLALLATGLQSSWAFSLLGPVAVGDDSWQQTIIGYNPLGTADAPPFALDGLLTGPKNIGKGYRRNAGYLVYACDANYLEFFGSNGLVAVDQAFALLNNVSNVDNYSTSLSEFPLNTIQQNYTASGLSLRDVKSEVFRLMTEQMGLADSVRYTWALHNRFVPPPPAFCNPGAPGSGVEYNVIMRNFDITATPLTTSLSQFPPYGQYSPYVNGVLYGYYILENCGAQDASPPDVDALEISSDPLADNPPVASFLNQIGIGYFYNGLTRDDVAGLRYLLSSNNIQTEVPAAGSLLQSYDFNADQLLYTSNLFSLNVVAQINNSAALQALYPGLVINSVSNYFALVVTTNVVIYQTNFPGSPVGSLSTVVAFNRVTNIQQFFSYTYGNLVILHTNATTPAILQTIQMSPPNGSPVGSPSVPTVTTKNIVLTNSPYAPSGDFYLLPVGACPYNFVRTWQTNVIAVTNILVSSTNGNLSYVQNLITFFTNHVYEVTPCTPTIPSAGLYQGIGRVQFVRGNFDSLLGQTFVPVTNFYTMTLVTNSQAVKQTFQRIVTAPDFLITASDFAPGPGTGPTIGQMASRRNINFDQTQVPVGSAGPGVINSPTTLELDSVGIVFVNVSPTSLTDSNRTMLRFVWGSFDGTTNDPVVYPNGTSIANLMSEILIQIYPSSLPVATNGSPYSVVLSASGGQSPYSWSLMPGSQLPNGLGLSPDGVISGIPTDPPGIYNFSIQMTDAGYRTVAIAYNFTIN